MFGDLIATRDVFVLGNTILQEAFSEKKALSMPKDSSVHRGLSWLYFIENILPLAPSCLLLGPCCCVVPNAAGLSGQKCKVVLVAEVRALLYFAV